MVERPPRVPLSLSVCLPCYNEEANVENTTRAALRALATVSDDFEIIIVDDGSRDRTGEIADRLAIECSSVRAVHNDKNLGYGGALQRGFREATKPWVFYTDGDGQFDVSEISKILPLLDEYDIISAYRLHRRDPVIRKINAFAWTALVNLMLGVRLRDIDCAFKIYPRMLFDQIEMRSHSALIDAEVLARAKRLGFSIGQIGVRHLARTAGTQTGASPRVILHALRELFGLWRDIRATTGSEPTQGAEGRVGLPERQ